MRPRSSRAPGGATRAVALLRPARRDQMHAVPGADPKSAADAGSRELETALAVYVRQVAERIGVPSDAVTHEVTDTATAYIGLTARVAALPLRDLMLVWDERLGWSIAIEPCGNDQPPVICHLGAEIAPAPASVARFVSDVVGGHRYGGGGPTPTRIDRSALAGRMVARPA
ncbi:DUF6292 family protein [Actinokineospora auranticolor]|uniref:DUF6292 domain-containing protein n=1 Tax=Actinokineospora auranticolor TaxID=155976 RepID=A0A2S6GLG5_9PSEU|nr:DUF6292 family protein [Actinokineospora auranticolor]PPK66078.1 hypothetical protein CLV40_11142 [Actinokineospora auranticolor]